MTEIPPPEAAVEAMLQELWPADARHVWRNDMRRALTAALPHIEQAIRADERRATVEAVTARIRHSADVIDADDVSRTARTLNRIALVIEGELGHLEDR